MSEQKELPDKEPGTRSEVQRSYSSQGSLGDWSTLERLQVPDFPERYTRLLCDEGILPLSDRAKRFIFYSSSANQGTDEYAMAKAVNASITHPLENPPLFIAADFFGEHKQVGNANAFVPGFVRQPDQEKLAFVKFIRVSADARKIPRPDKSVNVIWDRLGALWHYQVERKNRAEIALGDIERILNEYKRALAPHGCVVIDAGENPLSTYSLLTGAFIGKDSNMPLLLKLFLADPSYRVDIESLGWNTGFIGNGKTKLAVLTPRVQQE